MPFRDWCPDRGSRHSFQDAGAVRPQLPQVQHFITVKLLHARFYPQTAIPWQRKGYELLSYFLIVKGLWLGRSSNVVPVGWQ